MGKVLAIIVNLIGPRLLIVGGVLAGSEVFLDAVRRMVKFLSLDQASRATVIQCSTLNELAGARSAATMVLNALFTDKEANLFNLVYKG